jgi:uncharacterized protein (DUF1697 family)
VTHVAFLRAVNVGGKGVVSMADVVRVFERAGCSGVTSYGHAGNLMWTQGAGTGPVEKAHPLLTALLGQPASIMARTTREMAAIVDADPFGALVKDKTIKLYVLFLAARPKRVPPLPLRMDKDALELIAVTGREAYVVSRRLPGRQMYGFPNQFVEKTLGVAATSRNWSTVTKVAAMLSRSPSEPVERRAGVRPRRPRGAPRGQRRGKQ